MGATLSVCDINCCQVEVSGTSSRCVLHAEKNDYHADRRVGVLPLFCEQLIHFIVEEAFSYQEEKIGVTRSILETYLKGYDSGEEICTFAKSVEVVFSEIRFPYRDGRDYFDYFKVLGKIGAAHFHFSSFRLSGLDDLSDIKCFFDECIFYDAWWVSNLPVLANVNNVLYQWCVFHDDVLVSAKEEKGLITSQLFNNCEFKQRLELGSTEFIEPIFNNKDNMPLKIKYFYMYDCVVKDNFVLNNCQLGIFLLENSVFKEKVELKNNRINKFNVFDTNFFKIFDAYETKCITFEIKKSIFEDFVGFEKCQFGEDKSKENVVAKFVYATFLSFVNFRSAKFLGGVDLKNTNLKETPNFLDAEIDFKGSNRETFRIIKNSLDKVGNYIEANKYFAFEMQKYRDELKGTNKVQEKLVLFLNEKISNYGQSYIRPMLFMTIVSCIYYLLMLGYENNTLYKLYPSMNGAISMISSVFNNVAASILPFGKILKEGMEFVSLVFYLIFATLIWQTIVAIKRHTRR